jgi:hypothetical protein
MSLAASLERFVCHFGQYGLNWISNMIFLCKLTIVIPRLPCLFLMAKSGFIKAHPTSKMICKVWSLKARIKTRSFLEGIITSSNEVFKDCVSDLAVEIRKLGNLTRATAENNDTVKHTVSSPILTLQLQGKYSDQSDIACIFVMLNTRTDCND